MRVLIAVFVSSLAAVVVQPVVLFCWALLPLLVLGADLPRDQVGLVCLMAAIFSIPFVLFMGVPLTLLLQRVGRLRWWPLALTGAIAGAVFAGWSGPGADPGFSSGGNWYGKPVEFVVNGDPTLYGWMSYIQSVAAFAIHGLAGATAFYFVWIRCIGPNRSFKPNPPRYAIDPDGSALLSTSDTTQGGSA